MEFVPGTYGICWSFTELEKLTDFVVDQLFSLLAGLLRWRWR